MTQPCLLQYFCKLNIVSWNDKVLYRSFFRNHIFAKYFFLLKLAIFSIFSSEDESLLDIQLFCFSNFLIITSFPNFSFKTLFIFPISSTSPSSLAFLPDQNSPENNSIPISLLSLFFLLSSTTSIKS